jgi:TonB family protein
VKPFKYYLLTFIASIMISGCSSTSSTTNDASSEPIQYNSRCNMDSSNIIDSVSAKDANNEAPPITRISPKYPSSAARNGIEGYTTLEFDISSQGEPVNIKVIEAYPSDVFNSASIEALSAWRYEPKASECLLVQLDYMLN